MAQFTVNSHRFDPYKNFKFRVKWDGRYVAGVSKVSGAALDLFLQPLGSVFYYSSPVNTPPGVPR